MGRCPGPPRPRPFLDRAPPSAPLGSDVMTHSHAWRTADAMTWPRTVLAQAAHAPSVPKWRRPEAARRRAGGAARSASLRRRSWWAGPASGDGQPRGGAPGRWGRASPGGVHGERGRGVGAVLHQPGPAPWGGSSAGGRGWGRGWQGPVKGPFPGGVALFRCRPVPLPDKKLLSPR